MSTSINGNDFFYANLDNKHGKKVSESTIDSNDTRYKRGNCTIR